MIQFTSLLVSIESHSKTGSTEGREAVRELAEKLDCESLPAELRDEALRIKRLAQSKDWDPTLSPKTSKLLSRIKPDSKLDCVRRLNF